MKKTIFRSLFCLTLTLGMLVSLAACGGEDKTASSIVTTSDTEMMNATTTGTQDTTETQELQGTEATISTKASSSKPATTTTVNADNNTSLTVEQVMSKMPAKLKGTTLKFFFWEDLRHTVYKDAVVAFEKRTGITLKTEIASKSEYGPQLAARISSGASPDMIKIVENNVANVTNLQPITNSGFHFNDSGWDQELMHDFTFNGRVYAANVKDSPNRNMALVYYNKKALKRARLDDPYEIWKKNPKDWTWNKLWSMSDSFLKANGNRDGYYGITFGVEDGYPRSFGATLWRYDANQGKHVNLMKTEETVKRYGDIIDAVSKKWSTSVNDTIAFEQGKVLFCWGYSSAVEKDGIGFEDMKTAGNLGYVPNPTDSTVSPLFEYCAYGIPVGAKNAAAVPYFLRYVFAPETNNLDNFYISKEAREVCNSTIKKGNFFFGNGYNFQIWQAMLKGTSSNVKSVLDSYYGKMADDCLVNDAKIANLPK